jgi:hypothetical protein
VKQALTRTCLGKQLASIALLATSVTTTTPLTRSSALQASIALLVQRLPIKTHVRKVPTARLWAAQSPLTASFVTWVFTAHLLASSNQPLKLLPVTTQRVEQAKASRIHTFVQSVPTALKAKALVTQSHVLMGPGHPILEWHQPPSAFLASAATSASLLQ